MAITEGDTVTITYTGRLDDGTVFDTTEEDVAEESGMLDEQPEREFEPMSIDVGAGNLIEGFESALIGMEADEEKTVTIPPEEAYGEADGERVREFPRSDFEEMVGQEPAEGMQVRAQGGASGSVVGVSEDTVEVDFEHPLAGETLTFDIEVLSVE
ncbi:FKBP-type peptidyl-prolyl cis-trans isomerase [Haloplanus sp. C73]|uniref:FKBP-type peptidyl-prolyl cis-trans isomerase n=1 Tax=Haloplanus sp. C73 TaxID=3421641 RepID=UPI003EBDBC68